jgi:hypothetical protein
MNVRIKFPINFTAGIFYHDELQMNNYSVNLSMLTNSLDGKINNIALDRIKYFKSESANATLLSIIASNTESLKNGPAAIKSDAKS